MKVWLLLIFTYLLTSNLSLAFLVDNDESLSQWSWLGTFAEKVIYDFQSTLKLQITATNQTISLEFKGSLVIQRLQTDPDRQIESTDECFKTEIQNISLMSGTLNADHVAHQIEYEKLKELYRPFFFCYYNGQVTRINVPSSGQWFLNDANLMTSSILKVFDLRGQYISLDAPTKGIQFETMTQNFLGCRTLYMLEVSSAHGTAIQKSIDSDLCRQIGQQQLKMTRTIKHQMSLNKRLEQANLVEEFKLSPQMNAQIKTTLNFKRADPTSIYATMDSALLQWISIETPVDADLTTELTNLLLDWARQQLPSNEPIKLEPVERVLEQVLDGNNTIISDLPNKRIHYSKLLLAIGTERAVRAFEKVLKEAIISPWDATQSISTIVDINAPTFHFMKEVFGLCQYDPANKSIENQLEWDLFRRQCWINWAILSHRFVSHSNQQIIELTYVEQLRSRLFDAMRLVFDNNASTMKQKIFSLKVIGNLGTIQSIELVRRAIHESSQVSMKTGKTLATMPAALQLATIDLIRNVDNLATNTMIFDLLNECLDEKVEKHVHIGCISQFFNSTPSFFQMQHFMASLQRHNLIDESTLLYHNMWQRAIRVNDESTIRKLSHFCSALVEFSQICEKRHEFADSYEAHSKLPFSNEHSRRIFELKLEVTPIKLIAALKDGSGQLLFDEPDLLESSSMIFGHDFKNISTLKRAELAAFQQISKNSSLEIVDFLNAVNSVTFNRLSTGSATLLSNRGQELSEEFVRMAGYDHLFIVRPVLLPNSVDINSVYNQTILWPKLQNVQLPVRFMGIPVEAKMRSIHFGIFPQSAFHVAKPLLMDTEFLPNPTADNVRPQLHGGIVTKWEIQSSAVNLTFGSRRDFHIGTNAGQKTFVRFQTPASVNSIPLEFNSNVPLSIGQRNYNDSLFDLRAEWKLSLDALHTNKLSPNGFLNLELIERNSTPAVLPIRIKDTVGQLHNTKNQLLDLFRLIESAKNGISPHKNVVSMRISASDQRCSRGDEELCKKNTNEKAECTQCKEIVKLAQTSIAGNRAIVKSALSLLCSMASNDTTACSTCNTVNKIIFNNVLDSIELFSIETLFCNYITTPCASKDEITLKKAGNLPCTVCDPTYNSGISLMGNITKTFLDGIPEFCPASYDSCPKFITLTKKTVLRAFTELQENEARNTVCNDALKCQKSPVADNIKTIPQTTTATTKKP